MSIAKTLNAAKPYAQLRKPCLIGTLSKEDRKAVETSKERGVSYTTIVAVLKQNGLDVAASTIGRHVKGQCGCAKA